MAVRIEQGLVVAGAAAVVNAGVRGVVLRRIGACPAGAVPLPLFAARFPAVRRNADPARLPIEHAHGAVAQGGHGSDHIPQLPGLALHGKGIGLVIGGLVADGIAVTIGILHRIGIGGLGHHYPLAAALHHALQLPGQILQAAMPIGVIGGGEDVIVHAVNLQGRGNGAEFLCLRVGVVDDDLDIPVRIPHRLGGGGHQGIAPGHGGLAAEALGDLVADLYHVHLHPGLPKGKQALHCIIINGLLPLLQGHALPCLGGLLLGGVRPEIRIVKIHQ